MTNVGIAESRPPFLTFEQRAVEDRAASIAQGKYVSKDVNFVIVRQLGTHNTLENVAEDWLKNQENEVRQQRMDPRWVESFRRQYEAFKAGLEAPLDGTSVRNWPAISKAQAENLVRSGIPTIEDLAAVGEAGLATLGMGARDLRYKAQAWIEAAEKNRGAARIVALEADNANKDMRIAQLEQTVQALAAKVEGLGGAAIVPADRGAGLGDDQQPEPAEDAPQPARRGRKAA